MNNKEKQLKKEFFEKKNFDHILIISKLNRFWFTKFDASLGILLISKKEKPQLFLDARYFHEASLKVKNCSVKKLEEFKEIFSNLKGNIVFEEEITFKHYTNLQKINSNLKWESFQFDYLRLIKDKEEIENLKEICQITKKVWKEVEDFVKKPKTEKEVENFIIKSFFKYEINELAFFPIVVGDQNSAFIHTKATNHLIKNNLLCDFGGKKNGYCSDFSRTIVFNKQSELAKYHKIVEKIQKEVIKIIKPGIKIKKLIEKNDSLYKENDISLPHALGHGIGLKVHEKPDLFLKNELILKEGMVFTIEPGVYFPKIGGIRIEDVILVTEKGYEILTA